jgi:hypothetical protein
MKRIAINLLAAIGVIALVFLALRLSSHAILPGYDQAAKEQFGSPEAVAAIATLYSRLEAAPSDPALKVIKEKVSGFPSVRKIPRSWLPKEFSTLWSTSTDDAPVEFGNVLAYYDEKDNLLAIEFYGSRWGCFASRDATRCPSWFQSLHRLAEKPLYVTSRITGDE